MPGEPGASRCSPGRNRRFVLLAPERVERRAVRALAEHRNREVRAYDVGGVRVSATVQDTVDARGAEAGKGEQQHGHPRLLDAHEGDQPTDVRQVTFVMVTHSRDEVSIGAEGGPVPQASAYI